MGVLCDRVIIGGILFLVLFTPLAFGSVHPWAFSTVEVLVFLIVIVWMIKLTFLSRWESGEPHSFKGLQRLSSLLLPFVLFVTFVGFQLVPLPPSLLRIISPSTYEVYQKALPGWPEKAPYEEIIHPQHSSANSAAGSTWALLPTPDEIHRGAQIPFLENARNATTGPQPGSFSSVPWFPISIAPSLTKTDLLKFIAYGSLFFLVLFYPLGAVVRRPVSVNEDRRLEVKFARVILLMVLFSGLLIAALGIVQTFSWNGKILWFFEPYDTGISGLGIPRASGPFINPAHFGNYLVLIFFLSVAGAIFPTFVPFRGTEQGFRLFCVVTALVLLSAILLSLSRGAWIATVIGIAFFFFTIVRLPEEKRAALLRGNQKLAVHISVLGLGLLLLLSLFLVGPEGRKQVEIRLEETITQDVGLPGRARIWTASLKMFRDFPLWGVGLGSWPDIFPRYKSPPWTSDFYREAHNDYVELLAETGIIGFGLLAFFFWQCGKMLFAKAERFSARFFSVYSALLSALVAMAVHELLDFSLQIPANAILFTLILALALRLAAPPTSNQLAAIGGDRLSRLTYSVLPAVVVAVAVLLIAFVLRQDQIPYPYNLKQPVSIVEAKERLLSHPARASSHLSLLRWVENKVLFSTPLSVYRVGVWLEPANPYIRDLYASALLRMGKNEEGLKQLTLSVLNSPSFSSHFYLGGRLFLWLSAERKNAVEDGFKKALALEYPGAIQGLATFYSRLGRLSDEAKLYEGVALRTKDPVEKSGYLLKAGLAYVGAQEEKKAESLFRNVALLAPKNPKSYGFLATLIYAPRKDFGGAHAAISEGIKNGVDPFPIYLSLAQATRRAGSPEGSRYALSLAKDAVRESLRRGADGYSTYLSLADTARETGMREEEKEALLEALDLRPRSPETLSRLANLYFQEKNFDRAALYFSRITNINPNSGDAFFQLAVAEEGRYRFAAADRAYARALELARENGKYRQQYEAFKARLEENQKVPAPASKGQRAGSEG